MCSIFANLFYKIEVYVNFVPHLFSNTHVLLISTFFVQFSLFLSRPSYIFILAPPLDLCRAFSRKAEFLGKKSKRVHVDSKLLSLT
jgi:hypothetical protein